MGVHTPIPEKSLADSFYFSGALDEVRMWRRALSVLSAAEIRFYNHATIAMADTLDLGHEAHFPLNSAVCTA
jgi:hypothetical protein